jgi:exosortase A
MSIAVTAPLPAAGSGASEAWRRQLSVLGVAAAFILLLFWRDAADIVSIWWNSSTYNHCLLIAPLVAWLVWQRRGELAQLTPLTWLPGLTLVAAGALGWLLGYAGGIGFARHLGLALMLQGAIVTLLGKAVARGITFPLFFTFFLVPFGDELVPAMQTVTAKLSLGLLNLSGVPAHLEGVFITTPIGYFEVAEACAGVKFLIAMAALGALVANVCFRSWTRRILFMIACLVVPVLANGVRAWGTIHVAEGTSVDYATGFDHIVYGGIFFALVIAAIMGVAWRFFDRRVGEPWFDPRALQPQPVTAEPERRVWRAAAMIGLIAAAPLLWSAAIAAVGREAVPAQVPLPDVPGWAQVDHITARPWQPHFAGADHVRLGHYRDGLGHEVTLAIAVFARQEEGRELIGFGQGAVEPEGGWAWTADGAAPPNGRAELLASNGELREVVTFYRVGDSLTGSATRVKLETMKVRLIGGRQRAVAVMVSAMAPATGSSPRPAIDAFLASLGSVEDLADRASGGR